MSLNAWELFKNVDLVLFSLRLKDDSSFFKDLIICENSSFDEKVMAMSSAKVSREENLILLAKSGSLFKARSR